MLLAASESSSKYYFLTTYGEYVYRWTGSSVEYWSWLWFAWTKSAYVHSLAQLQRRSQYILTQEDIDWFDATGCKLSGSALVSRFLEEETSAAKS